MSRPWLVEGDTCWRKVQAERCAFLVDATSYFRAFKAAALQAEHSIVIIGWDVDSRTRLPKSEGEGPEVPDELGSFLEYLVARCETLRISVLHWDSPLFYKIDREWLPQAKFDWFASSRLHFALDDQHPIAASHHQKLVIIDDSIAFAGGMDLTLGRLDTREHKQDDPLRRLPDGSSYGPYHDVQIAVSGPAAEDLAELARQRWKCGTGQRLPEVVSKSDIWPAGVSIDLNNVQVGIARTQAAWKGKQEEREIEAMMLRLFQVAERSIYIENQYFSASRLAQVMERRLAEPEGPEFVLVMPREPTGWLEQAAITGKQRILFHRLRQADRHGRFRVYVPVVGEKGETTIKVHAKLAIADDRLMVVGSANLNNRSMGLDTECALAIESDAGSPQAKTIAALQDDLLAEHLGTNREDAAATRTRLNKSLVATIEKLRGPGRSLRPFPDAEPGELDAAIAHVDLLDPHGPAEPERLADEFVDRADDRKALNGAFLRLAGVLASLLALAALWRWGPLSEFLEISRLAALAEMRQGDSITLWIALVGFVIAGLTAFPITILIAAAGLVFGPLEGLLIAGLGSLLSAVAAYVIGALLGRGALRRLWGGKLETVSRHVARRGLLSMTVIRLLPIAPFTVVNLVSGASHISFRDFVLGTLFGMAPGIVSITLFSGQLMKVLQSPDIYNLGLFLAVLAAIVITAAWAWHRFAKDRWQLGGS